MRAVLVGLVSLVAIAVLAPTASAVDVRFQTIAGVNSPGTPPQYNRVGILKIGPRSARNILVLNPGTSASSAYFEPLAKTIVARSPAGRCGRSSGARTCSRTSRCSTRAKAGQATAQQVFDYYLGYLTNASITAPLPAHPERRRRVRPRVGHEHRDRRPAQGRAAGAKLGGRKVVVGGHSLGGTITTAYATWDFNGKAGADGLSGLVYIDGARGLDAGVARPGATQSLQQLQAGLAVADRSAASRRRYAGLFKTTGGLGVAARPELALGGPGLPAPAGDPQAARPGDQRRAVRLRARTSSTSPPTRCARRRPTSAQLDLSDDAARAGTTTARSRRSTATRPMFSGQGVIGHDGTAWYHPQRLTIDAGAVADGNANPAQSVLDVHATKGHDLPKNLKIYAFAAALGGPRRARRSTKLLAHQSGIPRRNLTLINRASTYAHNDPALGAPKKDTFVKQLVPYLESVSGS